MRSTAIYIFAILLLCSFRSDDGISQDQFKSIKKHLGKTTKVKYDRFEQRLLLTSPKPMTSTLAGTTTIDSYFFLFKDGHLGPRRFRLKWVGSSWLFIDEVTFLVGYGKSEQRPYKITFDHNDVQRDVLSGGSVSEKIDIPFNHDIISLLDDVMNTEKNEPVAIKISGKNEYITTATWTGKFKKMLNPIDDAYDYLANKKYK